MPEMRLAHLHPLRWLGQRDRGFAALRRATRAAIIMPALFALGDKVIGNPQLATYAAFGSFAMLLLVDFGGPMAERLQAQAALAVTGGVFVCLATLASQRGSSTCSAAWTNNSRWIAITRLPRRTRPSRRYAAPSWRCPTAQPG